MPASEKSQQKRLPRRLRRKIARVRVLADDPGIAAYVRGDLRTFLRQPPEDREQYRAVIDRYGFPRTCRRPSCRRRGRCTSPFLICHLERDFEFETAWNKAAENQERHGDPFHGL